MREYDYKEEANKLRAKRNFRVKFIKEEPHRDYLEKKLSKECKTLKEYQEAINEILDELENQTFEDEWDLEVGYQKTLDIFYSLGGVFSYLKTAIPDY